MKRKPLALASLASLFLLIVAVLAGSYSWFSSTRKSNEDKGANASLGYVGVDLQLRSYMIKADSIGNYTDYENLAGTPIPQPTITAFPSPFPPPDGHTPTPTVTPAPENYQDRMATLYPGSFYDANGHPLHNVQGVMDYYVHNLSSEDVIVSVNQKGIYFANQQAVLTGSGTNKTVPAGSVTSVDFMMYKLKDKYIYYADAPVSAINPDPTVPIPFVSYDLLKNDNFTPYDLFNQSNAFYDTDILNLPVTSNYDYTNPYGPDGFGLKMTPAIVLDTNVKLIPNRSSDYVFLFMPADSFARFLYTFSVLEPTTVGSVEKNFRNDYQYSVIALDTTDTNNGGAPMLKAAAVENLQAEFVNIFGSADAYTVNKAFNLGWTGLSAPSVATARPTKTPTPAHTFSPQ
jgi:hypothetical protein